MVDVICVILGSDFLGWWLTKFCQSIAWWEEKQNILGFKKHNYSYWNFQSICYYMSIGRIIRGTGKADLFDAHLCWLWFVSLRGWVLYIYRYAGLFGTHSNIWDVIVLGQWLTAFSCELYLQRAPPQMLDWLLNMFFRYPRYLD